MNSKMYTDLLGDILISFMDDKMEDSAIFQHDNASIYVSTITKSWFIGHNIHVLDWSACSPDMNPIENIWGILARRVYANSRQFGDAAELKQEINSVWRSIGQETLQSLIDSMPYRILKYAQKTVVLRSINI